MKMLMNISNSLSINVYLNNDLQVIIMLGAIVNRK